MKTLLTKFSFFLAFLSITSFLHSQVGLHFDGTDDCLVAANAGPVGASNRTIECWIKTNSTATSQQVLVNWGSMATGTRFTFNTIRNGKIRIELGGNGFDSNDTINDGNWHHVAVVYDHQAALKATLYIDGVLDTARNFTVSTITTNTVPITIGKRIDNINFFDGEMDEIKIWDIALSTAQLRTTMFKSFCTPQANLVAYYKLEEGIPNGTNTFDTIAFDYSGNNNHAALRNFNLQSVGFSNWVAGNPTILNDLNLNVSQNIDTLTAIESGATYQWLDCSTNTPLVNDTLQSLHVTQTGNYSVVITKGSCSDTSACIPMTITSLNEVTAHDQLYRISPNPILDRAYLSITDIELESNIQLYDLSGKLLEEFTSRGKRRVELDLNQYNSGLYFLKIGNSKGELKTFKVVKR